MTTMQPTDCNAYNEAGVLSVDMKITQTKVVPSGYGYNNSLDDDSW